MNKTPVPDAPAPDGGWVSANKHPDGGESDDGIDVDKTIDEECLSDDDLLRGSKFRFTPLGEAAKAVDTAAGAALSEGRNAKGMGLRRRGEGARWDSSGLGTGFKGLPRRYGGGNTSGRDNHVWPRLTNTAEMEYYRFAVASDPGSCCATCYFAGSRFWGSHPLPPQTVAKDKLPRSASYAMIVQYHVPTCTSSIHTTPAWCKSPRAVLP